MSSRQSTVSKNIAWLREKQAREMAMRAQQSAYAGSPAVTDAGSPAVTDAGSPAVTDAGSPPVTVQGLPQSAESLPQSAESLPQSAESLPQSAESLPQSAVHGRPQLQMHGPRPSAVHGRPQLQMHGPRPSAVQGLPQSPVHSRPQMPRLSAIQALLQSKQSQQSQQSPQSPQSQQSPQSAVRGRPQLQMHGHRQQSPQALLQHQQYHQSHPFVELPVCEHAVAMRVYSNVVGTYTCSCAKDHTPEGCDRVIATMRDFNSEIKPLVDVLCTSVENGQLTIHSQPCSSADCKKRHVLLDSNTLGKVLHFFNTTGVHSASQSDASPPATPN